MFCSCPWKILLELKNKCKISSGQVSSKMAGGPNMYYINSKIPTFALWLMGFLSKHKQILEI